MLLNSQIIDTTGGFWNNLEETDTIGKYYKDSTTSHILVFIKYQNSITYTLLEFDKNGFLINNEKYCHGTWNCYLDNGEDVFTKIGNFYCLKICNTGSSMCHTSLYLFNHVVAQDKLNPIYGNGWSNNIPPMPSANINSKMDFNDNEVIVHYKLEYGMYDYNQSKIHVETTDSFNVRYFFNGKNWLSPDSMKINNNFFFFL